MKKRLRNQVTSAAVALILVAVAFPPSARASRVKLEVATNGAVMPAGKRQIAYLKVGLTGFPLERPERRAPVNVAIVFLKTSMSLLSSRRSIVMSMIWRADSQETTRPARICPSSMAFATWIMPFSTPRQALETS